VRKEVVRGYEIHIVNAPLFVQRHKAIGDLAEGPVAAQTFPGDLVVLTEEAAQ